MKIAELALNNNHPLTLKYKSVYVSINLKGQFTSDAAQFNLRE